MSQIFIIGANGKVGRHAARLLQDSEHDVKVGLRSKDQFSDFEKLGHTPVHLDLEDDVTTITEALQGSDVVIFTAGSGGHTGADKTMLIDFDGAVKAVEAAEAIHAKQFIMVSALNADSPETWSDSMKPYYIAKRYADRVLKESSLNYTILRPGGLSDEAGTGNVTTDPSEQATKKIPREDVARVILAAIGHDKASKQVVTLLEGDTPINELF